MCVLCLHFAYCIWKQVLTSKRFLATPAGPVAQWVLGRVGLDTPIRKSVCVEAAFLYGNPTLVEALVNRVPVPAPAPALEDGGDGDTAPIAHAHLHPSVLARCIGMANADTPTGQGMLRTIFTATDMFQDAEDHSVFKAAMSRGKAMKWLARLTYPNMALSAPVPTSTPSFEMFALLVDVVSTLTTVASVHTSTNNSWRHDHNLYHPRLRAPPGVALDTTYTQTVHNDDPYARFSMLWHKTGRLPLS
jgi:hypothetical protein